MNSTLNALIVLNRPVPAIPTCPAPILIWSLGKLRAKILAGRNQLADRICFWNLPNRQNLFNRNIRTCRFSTMRQSDSAFNARCTHGPRQYKQKFFLCFNNGLSRCYLSFTLSSRCSQHPTGGEESSCSQGGEGPKYSTGFRSQYFSAWCDSARCDSASGWQTTKTPQDTSGIA